MNAGNFVGRVGALAVALGIGAAVSFGCSTAWAADDTSGGGSASSDSSAGTGATSGGSASSDNSGSTANAGDSSSSSQGSQQDSSETSGDSDDGAAGDASGTGDTDESASDDAEDSPADSSPASTKGDDSEESTPADEEDPDTGSRSDHPEPVEKAEPAPEKVVRSAVSAPDIEDITDTTDSDVQTAPSPAPDPVLAAQPQAVVVPTVAANPTLASAVSGSSDPLAAEPDPGAEPEAATTDLAVAVASSLLGNTAPGDVPVDTPAEWVLLAAARRELADPDPTSDPVAQPSTSQSVNSISVQPLAATLAVTDAAPADPIQTFLTATFQAIGGVVSGAISVLDDTITGALGFLGGTIDLASSAAGMVLNTAVNVVNWGITTTAHLITGALTTAVNALADAFDSVPTPFGDAIAGTLTFLNQVVTTTVDVLSTAVADVFTFTGTGLTTAITLLSDTVTGTLSFAADAIDMALSALASIINPNPNGAPVGGNDVATTAEDTALVLAAAALLANDSDPDSDLLSITAVGNGAHGTTSRAANGNITYTPAANYNGTDSFSYTVSDGTSTGTATVTITVTPVNDNPTFDAAQPDPVTGANGVVTGQVVAHDVDGDTLTYTVTTNGSTGTAQIDSHTGQYTYTPNGSDPLAGTWDGVESMTFTRTGPTTYGMSVNTDTPFGPAGSTIATVTQTAPGTYSGQLDQAALDAENNSPTNPAPWIVTDSTTFTFELIDDGSSLSYSIHLVQHDTNDGSVSDLDFPDVAVFTRSAATTGAADSFVVTVSDGKGGTATRTVAVAGSTTPTEHAPVAADDTAGTAEDTPLEIAPNTLLANDTDADHDALSVTAVGAAGHGTTSRAADGTITYTPAANYNGTDSFSYTVSDGALSSSATVTVTVDPVNDTPTAVDDTVSTAQGAVLVISPNTLLGNDTDVDGDPLSITAAGQGAHGTTSRAADGTITYTPAADYNGPDSFTYTASDGTAISTATVNVTITATPDPTDALSGDWTSGIPGIPTLTITKNGSAYDMSWPVDSYYGPAGTVFGSMTQTQQNIYEGAISQAALDAAAAKISAYAAATGGRNYTYPVPISEAWTASLGSDGTTLTVVDAVVNRVITVSDGVVVGSEEEAQAPVTITFSRVSATPVNHAPTNGVSNPGSPNTATGVVTGTVSATDIDGDSLTYTAPATTTKGSISMSGNTFTYTPTAAARAAAGAAGAGAADKQDTFTVTADDGHGQTLAIPVIVSIAAPAAHTAGTVTGTWSAVQFTATDPYSGDTYQAIGVSPLEITESGGVYSIHYPFESPLGPAGSVFGTVTETAPGTYSGSASAAVLAQEEANLEQAGGHVTSHTITIDLGADNETLSWTETWVYGYGDDEVEFTGPTAPYVKSAT